MIRFRLIIFLSGLISFLSCKTEIRSLSAKDTVSIIQTVLENKAFLKSISPIPDTVYILKSKLYNEGFPNGTRQLKLQFIDDSEKNRKVNIPNVHNDERIRLYISNFKYEVDTVKIEFLNVGYNHVFKYGLIKKGEVWEIKNISEEFY